MILIYCVWFFKMVYLYTSALDTRSPARGKYTRTGHIADVGKARALRTCFPFNHKLEVSRYLRPSPCCPPTSGGHARAASGNTPATAWPERERAALGRAMGNLRRCRARAAHPPVRQ